MRIISGRFKNKKLYFPKNLNTRPLRDSVRENIFNIIEHSKKIEVKIKNSNILDLYAGSGSFGIECLSRGASIMTFVENNSNTLLDLKKNIRNFKIESQSHVFPEDIFDFCKKKNKIKKKYDILFLDPPYNDYKYKEIFNLVKKNRILNLKHICIIHREKNSEKFLNNEIDIIENRIYGRSQVFFVKLF